MLNQPFIYTVILLGGLQGTLLGLIHILRPMSFHWTRWLGLALATHALSDIFLWGFWTRNPVDLRLLILLPLNIILTPIYFLFRYVRAFTQTARFGLGYNRFLATTACIEVILYLIPAGATLYTGRVDEPVILFAKLIRTKLNLASLPVVLSAGLVLYQIIKQYRNSVCQDPIVRQQVVWLYQLLTGLSIVYGLALLPMLVQLTTGNRDRAWFYPLGIGSSLFLGCVGSRSFLIHERFRPKPAGGHAPVSEAKPAKSNLYQQALQLIEGEQLYKQPSLKLTDIAGKLSVSPPHLSRIINQQANKNFNDLVNELRVAEVKRLMDDPAFDRYTLEGLGREAGFGAKSTYQASFKRLTGQTPSQYRANRRPIS